MDCAEGLDSLVADAQRSFSERNPRSRAQLAKAAGVMPGGNTRSVLFYEPFPLVMTRGSGCRLWDLDGHEYVDLLGEFTAGLYGHCHPLIRQAIFQAVESGLNLGAHGVAEAELARVICERFRGMERVRFTNSGTEANLMALAAATCFTSRRKILVFDGAYHGGVLSFVGGANAVNVPHDFIRGTYNDLEGTAALFHKWGSELAAVIIEPMLGSGGCIPATRELLMLVREATRECGCVLIFDEVMSSRLAGGGVQQILGLRADMTTLGKYVGGGSSIGAFGGRTDIMSLFDPTRPDALPHAGTFNNNVISMAAGLIGLTRIYTPEEAEALTRRGSALREDLNRICQEMGAPLQVTGLGSLMNFHATREQISRPFELNARQQAIKSLLFFHLLERGFYMARRGFIALSMVVGTSEIAGLLEAVREFGKLYEGLWP